MIYDTKALYELLPAVLRLRDAERGRRLKQESGDATDRPAEDFGPLKGLLSVIAEQVAILEDDLERLYDDQFIETCQEWVIPYIGDLVRARTIHEATEQLSLRAQVADTIAMRRRKGTVAALEDIAAKSTNWPARAVEYFPLLAVTHHMNHVRQRRGARPDLRDGEALDRIGGAFDPVARNVDVRRIATARGRYNIADIGIFLWRLDSNPHTRSTAFRVAADRRDFLFSPLGRDLVLFSRGESEAAIDSRTTERHMPLPIRPRAFHRAPGEFYGVDKSLAILVDDVVVPVDEVRVCNLADIPGTGDVNTASWNRAAEPVRTLIDPARGRFVLAEAHDPGARVEVIYHTGSVVNMGGGEYEREARLQPLDAARTELGPGESLADALTTAGGDGTILITGSGRYDGPAAIDVPADGLLKVAAANGAWPSIALSGETVITGGANAELELNGLRLFGGALRIEGGFRRLVLKDVTLVPGHSVDRDGTPVQAGVPSLVIGATGSEVLIDRCITGGITLGSDVDISITESIVDSADPANRAVTGLPGAAGEVLSVESSTIIGQVAVTAVGEVSNAILLAARADPADPPPVDILRRQVGCVRFSYVPWDAVVPRRYRCVPGTAGEAHSVMPIFTSLRYGDAAYGQLDARTAARIRDGSEDRSEMGAFRRVQQRARENNLKVRIGEFTRLGMETGFFYES